MPREWVRRRFVAVPVGQGDAFFLETPDGSVLVDAGKSMQGFAKLFTKVTGRSGVDILVCTHNDADHANGVLGFLEMGLACNEVWLPGRWLRALPHALNPTPEVFEALIDQARVAKHTVEELRRKESDLPERRRLIEIYGDHVAEQGLLREERQVSDESTADNHRTVDGWPPKIIEALESAAEGPDDIYPVGWLTPSWWFPNFWGYCIGLEPMAAGLLVGALEAAQRIRNIALAAFHQGVAVRWFEYDISNPAGGNHWLRPLNAKAVAYVPPPPLGRLFSLLALTTANRESLVFYANTGAQTPPVLFTADSDLKGIYLPPLAGAIVTAPHHGSEANRGAYTAVQMAAGSAAATITWIRSDGRFRARPGASYIGAPGRRICTLCRSPMNPKRQQRIYLYARNNRWIRGPRVARCCCQ
ncbi:MAG TPA: MBL fold metallo-hydrolase [Candidatus Acidoferrales bacterium]|nr:MBL fold metallo-hydrolase [Candidatus Acidoferrales bacterium]